FHSGIMKSFHQAGFVVCRTHSPAATASRRLDHDGISYLLRDLDCFLLRFNDSIASRRHGNAGLARRGSSRVLVSHGVHGAGRWTDEFYSAAFAYLGEVRILREKSVTGMNRINISHLGRAHDSIDL